MSVLFDQAAMLVLETDAAGKILRVLGDAQRDLALPAEEVRGRSLFDVASGRPYLLRGVREALAGRHSVERASGKDRAFDVRFDPIPGEHDAIGGCLVLALPTAPPEAPREPLPARDSRLRLLFQQIPGAIWATDRELRVTYAAGRLRSQLPLRARRMIGRYVHDIATEVGADDEIVMKHLSVLAGRTMSFQYDFHDRSYEVQLEPLRNGGSNIVGCTGVAIDVTELRQAENLLAGSQARLAEAQCAAGIGSWEWDVVSNAVTWSDELYRIYGLPPSGFDGSYEGFLAHVHPDDREETRRVIFTAFRDARPFAYDHRIVRADGTQRMLHTRGDVRLDAHQKVIRMVGSCLDVTDRWQAEQATSKSLSLLRATLDSTADGLLVVDTNGRVSAFNDRFLAIWQLPASLVTELERPLLELASDQLEDPDAFRARVLELYDHPLAESLETLRFKDGRVIERYSRPQRLGNEVVGRVWSFRDVTERERLLRSAVLLSDASRLLFSLEIEKAIESVAHLTLACMGEACAVDLFTDEGGPRRLFSIARDPMNPITAELPRATLAGHSFTYSVRGDSLVSVPLLLRGDVLGALTFASRRRRYNDRDVALAEELAVRVALAVSNARLFRRANEALAARDEFLAIAAHELRGPVTAQHLAVQALRQGPIPVPASAKALEIIEREDRRLGRFVSELMDVSQVRKDKLHFDLEQVNLSEVVRDAAGRLSGEITHSGSALNLTLEAAVTGVWDGARLNQVATSLLSNAIKFGLGKPIEVSVRALDGTARLVVKDLGIGIPLAKHQQVFEPFERAVSGRHYGGLGLGLFIARTIVEALGGTIRLESAPGEGTTVTVDVPRRRPP